MATLQAAPPGTVTLNNSVEYLPTNAYLALISKGREGREKLKCKMACKQQAIATTLWEELQTSSCAYKTQGTPARGIGPPQYSWKNY